MSRRVLKMLAVMVGCAIAQSLVTLATIVVPNNVGPDLDCCRTTGSAALSRPIVAELDYTLDSLPNGLRYYICARKSSSDRTELRLVVDAGSIQEDDDQRGLAHAVEHMVFGGTRTFPHGAIERYFEAIGMRRGDDVNAGTSLDDTQFRFTIPTSRAGAVDTALAMLASMAHEATFDAADARKESGVLLEEWRSSRDVYERIEDARHPLLYAGTAYANRLVIGDTGVLRRFDVGALRRYYETWYRPELMAVVVVGDFEPKKMEALVRRHFSKLAGRGPRRARPVLPAGVESSTPLRASVIPDPEARSTWIGIWHQLPRQQYYTRADYRAGMIARLWQDILRGRLEDAALRPDSPLASVDVERRKLARNMAADVVSVTAMKGETLPALQAAIGEMKELAARGPTPEELQERVRAIVRRANEQAQNGDGAASLASEFIDHFLTGNAIFTTRLAYELARDVLPAVTVNDVRSFARGRIADSGDVIVLATSPDDSAGKLPAATIVASARSPRQSVFAQRGDEADVERLLATEPTPGQVVAEQKIPEIHAYQWTLSNGMHVLLKPTSFTFDEVQFRAVAPGGASVVDDDRYPSAYLADAVIEATGVGRIPAPRLERWLDATSISLTPTVSDDAIFLDGQATPGELERFLQLAHLYLTSPRRDTVAFRRYRARMASLVEGRERDPAALFRDSVTTALAGNDPRAIKNGARFYLRTRMDDALDFWTRRTANGAGFTVAFVGDFTLARVRPLIERYLASIPRGAAERPRDRGVAIVTRGVRRNLPSGIAARARAAIGFAMPFTLSNENLNALNMMREVVTRSLTDRLRDQMGGTYGVDVSLAIDLVPPSRYTMTIEFESSPERIEALTAAALDELSRLRRSGPSEAQYLGAREARVRDFDGRSEDNEYWVSELTFHARHGWPLSGIAAHRREVESITLEDLRRACATYLPAKDFVRVTMRPDSRLHLSAHPR